MLTADRARELVSYNPETGVFVWRVQRNGTFRNKDSIGWVDSHGYRLLGMDGRKYKAHRVAWLLVYGEWPKSQLDHINRDRADNRIANLREVTNAENGQNAKPRTDGKSGVVGVHFLKNCNRWWAYINTNRERVTVGYFESFEEAVAARADAKKAQHIFNL